MKEYVEHRVKSRVETFFKGFVKVIVMILAAIVFLLLLGYGFMWLWNWLMPEVFGLPMLSYWKAVGILFMAKLLFGNFTGEHHKRHSKKSRRKSKNGMRSHCQNDFSKWEYYDEFWNTEGKSAFEAFVERQQNIKE